MTRFLSLICSIVLLLSGLSKLEAQEASSCKDLSSKQRATTTLNLLHELSKGTLLVEINDQKKTLEKLDELVGKAKSEEAKQGFLDSKARRLTTIRNWAATLIPVFKEYYNFSDVRFYYRSDRADIENPEAKIWLNDDGEKVVLPQPLGPDYAVLSRRTTPNKGLEAFFFLDKNFQTYCPPAPQYFKLNTLSSFFKWGKKEEEQKAKKLAQNVSKKFVSLYERLKARGVE